MSKETQQSLYQLKSFLDALGNNHLRNFKRVRMDGIDDVKSLFKHISVIEERIKELEK
jgi:hypothetical protein